MAAISARHSPPAGLAGWVGAECGVGAAAPSALAGGGLASPAEGVRGGRGGACSLAMGKSLTCKAGVYGEGRSQKSGPRFWPGERASECRDRDRSSGTPNSPSRALPSGKPRERNEIESVRRLDHNSSVLVLTLRPVMTAPLTDRKAPLSKSLGAEGGSRPGPGGCWCRAAGRHASTSKPAKRGAPGRCQLPSRSWRPRLNRSPMRAAQRIPRNSDSIRLTP
eukprot:COSAG04_NODE_534_length_12949_cov_5.651673_5_plen_222_part_00